MKRIPKFKSLDEAADFWDRHDFEDYVGDTEPVSMTVKIKSKQKLITIPLDLKLYEKIEALASKRGISVERVIAAWLKEKATAGGVRR